MRMTPEIWEAVGQTMLTGTGHLYMTDDNTLPAPSAPWSGQTFSPYPELGCDMAHRWCGPRVVVGVGVEQMSLTETCTCDRCGTKVQCSGGCPIGWRAGFTVQTQSEGLEPCTHTTFGHVCTACRNEIPERIEAALVWSGSLGRCT
jgi:hypothetical protein